MGQAYTASGKMPPRHSSTTLSAVITPHSASSLVVFLIAFRLRFSMPAYHSIPWRKMQIRTSAKLFHQITKKVLTNSTKCV